MDTYYAAYKCQLCGKTLRYGEPAKIPYNVLPELCGKIVQNQMFQGNHYLYKYPMHAPCKCPDGSCGPAYFVGFKKV